MGLLLQLRQTVTQGFTAVWSRWPRKEAKKDAQKAWTQLDPSPDLEDTIHRALDWQIPMLEEREPRYRPLLASWLRGERWTDEPPAPAKPKPSGPKYQTAQESIRAMEQQRRISEAQRLMRDEKLSQEEAIRRAFKP